MQNGVKSGTSRKDIFVRLLFTVLYLVVFEIIKFIIQLTVIFQYIYLFITLGYSNSVRSFSNKVSTYAYEVMRYLTLNKNDRPYPFNDFPAEMEQPVEDVTFRD